ncbi:acetyl-CoA carboxylase carboxyltransferase subunit alpha [Fangia hongkongensis]|uniref:acetyl-CoA carboxylase carboxyltransferase subunit alpha n=1 Tax=Fangia hongkongensis TaxID=270495 RepID=UPI00037EB6F8|nr:acetyl-CoA carboxylase carboxyltransferase subunit alpha [Fangia hongkongensis]MBK2124252.1 acetyl-CoA carboxylase carboxyltransferase subunit alpha [Fangia hongkongensis]
MQFLEFEKPIAELEAKIEALAKSDTHNEDIQKEINKLQTRTSELMKKVYSSLSDWQIIQLARHPERPYFLDLVNKIFDDFQELHGDRAFADDKAVIGGLAGLNGQSVMVIGQEKGRKTKDKLRHNFGMMHPEGYRKALRLMKLAEKFSVPVITFIDTPGAYPGIKAEERGQSEAIARNLMEMAKLNVPIICVVIGEGCSGGALGIGVGDKLVMLEYSYFATISPEGCASILWKTADKAADAAEIMGITANRLKELNIIDEVIKEPLGGAHRNVDQTAEEIQSTLTRLLSDLSKLDDTSREELRYQKLMSFGAFDE